MSEREKSIREVDLKQANSQVKMIEEQRVAEQQQVVIISLSSESIEC